MDKKKATVMSIINDAKTFQDDIATALKFCNRAERAVQMYVLCASWPAKVDVI